MKKIIGLILLMLVLVSCGENNIVRNEERIKIQEQIGTGIVKEEKNESKKDLGNGFILKQNMDNSILIYNGNEIYSWLHTSKIIPFIWDEGCDKLTEELIEVGNNGIDNWKQNIWESLGESERQKCLKENYYKTLSISKIDEIFYTINKGGYESIYKILFESQNNKIYQIGVSLDEIFRIENGKSGIFILFKGWRGNDGGVLFVDKINDNQKILFRNTDNLIADDDYREIVDFELMTDKQVKIFYKGKNLEKMEKIVKL
ncbi:MAG: hypothetical protein QM490_05565 [Candidatus Gracilibacteria bacterium]